MGGTMAWWSAALDERIKVCIDICSLTDYQTLIDVNGLSHHGIYYYIHGLLKHFTSTDINALIAPRPHLGNLVMSILNLEYPMPENWFDVKLVM